MRNFTLITNIYFSIFFDQFLDPKLWPNLSNPWNGGVAVKYLNFEHLTSLICMCYHVQQPCRWSAEMSLEDWEHEGLGPNLRHAALTGQNLPGTAYHH